MTQRPHPSTNTSVVAQNAAAMVSTWQLELHVQLPSEVIAGRLPLRWEIFLSVFSNGVLNELSGSHRALFSIAERQVGNL